MIVTFERSRNFSSIYTAVQRKLRTRKSVDLVPVSSELDPLFSQKGQVRFVLQVAFNYPLNGLKRQGYFVDLAAGAPRRLSNTYFLEQKLCWSGLLIEPNPKFAEALRKERSSPVAEVVVTDKSEEVLFRVDNGELGGIVGEDFDNSYGLRGNQLSSADIRKMPTQTLHHVLKEFGAPRHMDYLSLDIEGAEWTALKNLDFDQWKWRCMTVERPSLELNLLLDDAGYIQVQHSHFDTFYIHKSHIDQSNLSNEICSFRMTPKKDW